MTTAFPLGRWSRVLPPRDGSKVTRVRIEAAAGAGFLFLTEEGGAQYDVWLQTEAEVVEALVELGVSWDE